MKPTVLLHIGFPKTGTTSIQYRLKKGAREYLSQGVDVLANHSDKLGGHHSVLSEPPEDGARGLNGRRLRFKRGFLEEVDFDPKLHYLLTSEDFAQLAPEELCLLQAAAPHHEIRVFACTRPQWESIPRVWATAVWAYSSSHTIRGIVDDSAHLFDYYAVLQGFVAVIGERALSVCTFPRDEDPVSFQLIRMLALLGCEIDGGPTFVLNQSPPAGLVRIRRAFNEGGLAPSVDWPSLRDAWQAIDASGTPEENLTPGEAVKIVSSFRTSNQQLQVWLGVDLSSSERNLGSQLARGRFLGSGVRAKDILIFREAIGTSFQSAVRA